MDKETAILSRGETVTIADRRFPIVGLVCPEDPCHPERSEQDRSLGTGRDDQRFIPAENGVIFVVTPDVRPCARPGTLELHMTCAACERSEDPADWTWMWLPIFVHLHEGQLVTDLLRGTFSWPDANPDWVAETIDRLSRLPFTMPDGPLVQMIPRDKYGSFKKEKM